MRTAGLECRNRRGHRVVCATQASSGRRRVAAVHRQRQLANRTSETAALAQHHGLLGQHGGRIRQHKFGNQGLPGDALVSSLLGFNVGVELGQLAIVAVFLPLAFAMRATRFYSRVVFTGGSVVVAVLAAIWLAERALDIKLLS